MMVSSEVLSILEPSIAMGDFFVLQPNGTDFDVIGKIRMRDK